MYVIIHFVLMYSVYDVPWNSFVGTFNVNLMKESIVGNRQRLFFFKIQYYFNLIVSYRPPFNMMGLSFCNVLTSVSGVYVGGLSMLVRSSLEETVWCGFTFSYIKSQGTITKALPCRRAKMNINYLCCKSYSQRMYIKCYIFAAVTWLKYFPIRRKTPSNQTINVKYFIKFCCVFLKKISLFFLAPDFYISWKFNKK